MEKTIDKRQKWHIEKAMEFIQNEIKKDKVNTNRLTELVGNINLIIEELKKQKN